MKSAWLLGALLLAPMVQQQAPTSGPLSLEHAGQMIASVERADYSLPGQTVVDTAKLDALIAKLEQRTYEPPLNAVIGDNGKIVAGRTGYTLNREALAEQFYAYFYGNGPARFELQRRTVYPKVDSELLAHIRQKPIGSYVTYYNSGNKSRSHNIALSAKAINNHVVFPGETFSFNRIVGERTAARGYKRAPIIVRGELSEGIGGGICQVSSTLFNAIDRAGLRIVQRYSHSRHVPYVLPGRDATVSWGGPDFTFQNAYNQPVLIRAFAGGGSMSIALYSSDSIEYKPREVPGITKTLPEEVPLETDADRDSRGTGAPEDIPGTSPS
ncbi:VanW family protein [Paenibacillus hodogayensis]|uniref:VanW family protein n=1 Tax=Paenibacillus hodogayensis TaxID=279208 RepID=A0ABV5VQS3_9BACL